MSNLISPIEAARMQLAIAFGAYIADPSAYHYARMEAVMLAYQDVIYGDHAPASN